MEQRLIDMHIHQLCQRGLPATQMVNLIETYNVRQNKDEIYMRINPNKNFNGYIADILETLSEEEQLLIYNIPI